MVLAQRRKDAKAERPHSPWRLGVLARGFAGGGLSLVPLALLILSMAGAPAAEPGSGGPIKAALQKFVDDGQVAGAVGIVADRSGVRWHGAVGKSDLATGRAMEQDDIFWIASMTKPMTGAGIAVLEEQGKLSAKDPVEKYLPEFKGMWVIASQSKDEVVLKRPARPITIHDLLTHSSGLNDFEPPRHDCSLAELAMAYSQKPLLFEPGTKWKYCNTGINTLGRIIEVVSGMAYADFMRERLFEPLGMKETTFWPSGPRVAKSYKQKEGGGLEEIGIRHLKGDLSDRSRTAFPMGGLFSTAHDVARFYRMMLCGGELDGRRVLAAETVAKMTSVQSGDLKTGFVDGMGYGYACGIVREPQGVTAMLSPGTFGHGGAHGTQSWADPKRGIAYILMIQRAGLPNADASDVRLAFQRAAVSALP